jgi:hypothetical protein
MEWEHAFPPVWATAGDFAAVFIIALQATPKRLGLDTRPHFFLRIPQRGGGNKGPTHGDVSPNTQAHPNRGG